MELDSVGMMPLVQARPLLDALPMRLTILAPPYPAIGCGTLRVLRVRERDGCFEVVAGYEAYDKLPLPVAAR